MSLKRAASSLETTPAVPTLRRTKPVRITYTAFRATNCTDGEVVHQACLLLKGVCHSFENSNDDFVSVTVVDCFEKKSSIQNWPVDQGHWKALVMLSPGRNRISLEFFHAGAACDTLLFSTEYVPLLQLPPLHLAIMVAQDSPLLIDCPPAKRGALSSTHSTLDAAISKFRLTAYMWQALTAADAFSKGLGRRSFRLDEEWCHSTTEQPSATVSLGSVAKVHVVRTTMTVAELRDADLAQQSGKAVQSGALHHIFKNALETYGAPFESHSRPVVAGLILDSTYSIEKDINLGHSASGRHNVKGISLGIFGSHLTYAWPRFMEEIPACLMDKTPIGNIASNNDNGCKTFQEACWFGQSEFLRQVGHAFGVQRSSDSVGQDCTLDWQRACLGHINSDDVALWDLQNMLTFKSLPHFWLPGEMQPSSDFSTAEISLTVGQSQNYDEEDTEWLTISCAAGLARVRYTCADTRTVIEEKLFDRFEVYTNYCSEELASSDLLSYKNLELSVLANNGKVNTVANVWRLMAEKTYINIPGHSMRLRKQSIKCSSLEEDPCQATWNWTNLLYTKDKAGKIHCVNSIDLRVGCTMDGAIIYYDNGSPAYCGPNYDSHGRLSIFGGGESQRRSIPPGVEIAKVELNAGETGWSSLNGIRITLDNGKIWGELNERRSTELDILTLTPPEGERVVGFYGRHPAYRGYTLEFGIITAPKNLTALPDVVFEMEELRNTDGGLGRIEGAEMPTAEVCQAHYRWHDQHKDYEKRDDEDAASEDSDDYDGRSEHTLV